MSKFLIIFVLPLFVQAEMVRVVHYNIKELDSEKISQEHNNTQVAAAILVLNKLKPDFLSINEIQFDLPNVPDANFQTQGQNLEKLLNLLTLNWEKSFIGFGPANTGTNSKMIPGTKKYSTNTQHREFADPVNFGVFPAQYSSGGATRFEVLDRVFIKDLKWLDFKPNRDLSGFKDADGKPLNSKEIQLFDKNFMDMVLKIAGQEVHFILLHTVPAHDFDISNSPNSARNADQLSFLEWYLTGKTDFVPPSSLNIKPLKPGSLFVAMGDWNVDVRNLKLPGAKILKRLFTKTNLWVDFTKLNYTYESQAYYLPPFRDQLDYIITSKSSHLKILDGGVYAPFERYDLGCSLSKIPTNSDPKLRIVTYKDKSTYEKCYAAVSTDYAEVKAASDHRPLWMNIEVSKKF